MVYLSLTPHTLLKRLLSLFLACLLWHGRCFDFPYTEIIEAQFHHNFQEKCLKPYPHLVQQFVNKLESPGDRYLMFVFEEPSLKNGGLGDRLAGLVSAVAMALRFNRTLLIRDSSGLSKLFRPYHPIDIEAENPRFLWHSYLSWSHYDPSLANHDETEYDLYYCINHTTGKTSACSMSGGDVSQPIILLRCNRVYLCHYETDTQSVAHNEWRNKLGISAADDLYELSGCFLRLALWPTRELWRLVDQHYFSDLYSHLLSHNITHNPSFHTDTNSNHNKHHNRRKDRRQLLDPPPPTPPPPPGRRRRSLRHSFNLSDESERDGDDLRRRHNDVRRFNKSSGELHQHLNDFYQIGVHFRCGDHSYSHTVHDYDCRYEVEHPSSNSYMLTGNPYELSLCTRELLRNHTMHLMQQHKTILSDEEIALMASSPPSSPTPSSSSAQFVMFFTASDNDLSTRQIEEVIQYSHTLTSPSGCHVEWDRSSACTDLTMTYWFMMAMSRHLSVQIIADDLPAPGSSFSRYAGMYGLHSNPFQAGKRCSDVINTLELSRRQHNNWFC